jgi:hypothetical protein
VAGAGGPHKRAPSQGPSHGAGLLAGWLAGWLAGPPVGCAARSAPHCTVPRLTTWRLSRRPASSSHPASRGRVRPRGQCGPQCALGSPPGTRTRRRSRVPRRPPLRRGSRAGHGGPQALTRRSPAPPRRTMARRCCLLGARRPWSAAGAGLEGLPSRAWGRGAAPRRHGRRGRECRAWGFKPNGRRNVWVSEAPHGSTRRCSRVGLMPLGRGRVAASRAVWGRARLR